VKDPSVDRARGGDNSTVFEIESGDVRCFVKIGDRLARECAVLGWLLGRLPVPRVVAFDQVGALDALLMTAVPDTNLAARAKSRLRPSSLKCSPPRFALFIPSAPEIAHLRHISPANRSSMATPACRISSSAAAARTRESTDAPCGPVE
jgi:hypothetical protein